MKDTKQENKFKFILKDEFNIKVEAAPRKSAAMEAITDFFKNKLALIGLFIFIGLIITGVIVIFTSPYGILETNSDNILQSSSKEHWFGTDEFGRDIWLRLWYGMLQSIQIALIASLFNIVIASLVGTASGYFDGVDKFFNPIIKVFYSVPVILVLILFSVVFGPSFWVIIISLTITGWVGPSQQVRAHTLRTRNLDFITASQTLGTSRFKILGTLLTVAIPTIIIQFSMLFPRMILAEATLGFLGLSTPDIPTLGMMINIGRGYILLYPMQIFYPIIFLVVVVGSIQFISFGVENAFGSSRTGR